MATGRDQVRGLMGVGRGHISRKRLAEECLTEGYISFKAFLQKQLHSIRSACLHHEQWPKDFTMAETKGDLYVIKQSMNRWELWLLTNEVSCM